jgi:hypothetical protein
MNPVVDLELGAESRVIDPPSGEFDLITGANTEQNTYRGE